MSTRIVQKKEKQKMTSFENFVTEGNEWADEMAKYGALLDGGDMAQRVSTFQQRREEVYPAPQYAAKL